MTPGPLGGYRWHRLVTVPRVSDVSDPRRWLAAGITAAVATAHAQLAERPGAGLAVAWVRPPDGGPLRFLLGGDPDFPAVAAGPAATGVVRPVLFPPGASAEAFAGAQVLGWFDAFPRWLRCLGTTAVDAEERAPEPAVVADPPAGLDDYALHLRAPFAWLLVAEPATREDLEEEAAGTSARLTTIRKRESSESHRVELDRGQRRMRELSRARGSGLWRVHVLAGSFDDLGARRAANLLCGAADAAGAGHMLFPADKAASLSETWSRREQGPDRATAPFLAGTDLVATLARPPVRELPGIRLQTPYRFDVTPVPQPAGSVVDLGSVLDESLTPVGRFTVPYPTLNRHGFICGATGSGKSQTARRLLEALSTGPRRIPWLVVEPAKAEYAAMADRLAGRDDVLVIRPGQVGVAPASLNPLEPEPGFSLQSHADLVRALFLAAFEATEPFPQVLSHALTECYTSAGWNLVTGRPASDPAAPARRPRYPGLRELQSTARRVVDNIGYGDEIAANVRGFVDVRMGSLRQGSPGRFFEGGHPLDVGELLRRNAVLELEDITNDQDKAFLMGTVLIRIVEHLRVRKQLEPRLGDELAHVLLIEEAHRLLKNVDVGPAAAAVELFASLLAEIRAYGEGVVVVEQIPSKILPDVIKNTAFKLMHRLPAADDRDAVGGTMNLTEQNSEAVVSFPPGIAAVSVDGDDRPLLVGVDGATGRETAESARRDPPLRGRRSPLCGRDCLADACSLAQIDAADSLASNPSLVVWSDAVAASMVVGRRAPIPSFAVTSLWRGDRRLTDCTLALLADRSMSARSTRLAEWVAPEDFAARLRQVLAARLQGETVPRSPAARWRAGPFRWRDVYSALRTASEADGEAGPHPLTGAWRERGLYLSARTTEGQFRELKNHPAYADGGERVVHGDVDVSGVRRAIRSLAGTETPAAVVRAYTYACELPESAPLLAILKKHYPADSAGRRG